MSRHRTNNSQSSFDLFLDTVCNTFGGVLFIAILLAVMIRQVQIISSEQQSPSPKEVAALQEELATLCYDIELSQQLLRTLQKTIPQPQSEIERKRYEQYHRLSEERTRLSNEKQEKMSQFLTQIHINATLEESNKKNDELIAVLSTQETQLEGAIQEFSVNNTILDLTNIAIQEHELKKIQGDIDDITDKIAQKEKTVSTLDQSDNARKEMVNFPKLKDINDKDMALLVLRYNRLYFLDNVDDFNMQGFLPNELGVPRQDCGIILQDEKQGRKEIGEKLRRYSPTNCYLTVIVYPDSFEKFYIVRGAMLDKKFQYELLLSQETASWYFGESERKVQVQ